MIRAKVIAIGDEILIGQIVNSNAAYIGKQLYNAGIPLDRMITIGDEEEPLLTELEDSAKNFDVTIITGGLGPTHDDLTKPILVKFFEDELVFDEEVMKDVENIFKSRNIYMPDMNREQAMVPKSAKVILNKNGTAPGIWLERDGKVFVSMPGVPYEMKAMMTEYVIPNLREYFKDRTDGVMKYRTILTSGIGESTLFEKVGDLKEELKGGKLAYLPSASGVRLRVEVKSGSEAEADLKLDELEKIIRGKAGEYIYGTGDMKLEEIVGEELKKKGLTLSIAESCTGGRISASIVSVAGSSEYYEGGVCSYSYDAKVHLLGVDRETLEKYGAVSEEVAIQMVEGVRKKFGTDISLSATGIAGPGGGMPDKPVGMVWIGYSNKDKTYAVKFNFGNNRERNIERTTVTALQILRKELAKK